MKIISNEIWMPILGCSDYLISDCGRVWSWLTNKSMANANQNTGYYSIRLKQDNGTYKMFLIHRLVAEAFLTNPEGKEQINHKDFNKRNNNLDNLEWVTRRENLTHYRLQDESKTSKYIGVSYLSNRQLYCSSITIDKTRIVLGVFESEIEASELYQKALKDYNLFGAIPKKKARKIPKEYISKAKPKEVRPMARKKMTKTAMHRTLNTWPQEKRLNMNKTTRHLHLIHNDFYELMVVQKDFQKANQFAHNLLKEFPDDTNRLRTILLLLKGLRNIEPFKHTAKSIEARLELITGKPIL